jgi:hypothetical protein
MRGPVPTVRTGFGEEATRAHAWPVAPSCMDAAGRTVSALLRYTRRDGRMTAAGYVSFTPQRVTRMRGPYTGRLGRAESLASPTREVIGGSADERVLDLRVSGTTGRISMIERISSRRAGSLTRRARVAALLAGLVLVATAPGMALAAAPANDLPGGAIALTAIPVTIDENTTDATVTTDNIGCGDDGTDQATVWFTLTLASATSVLVDATGSDYSVGVNIFAGTADADNFVVCSEGAAAFDAAAGTTYYLMFADIDGDATNGGALHAVIDVAPPPIEVSLTVDSTGKVNQKSGEATISGTITCSRTADFSEVDVTLRQAIGRFTIHGFGAEAPECGPTPTNWFASIAGDNGKFGAGKATADVFAFACDVSSCGEASVLASVRLRK